jgi:serine/threonine protein kinase
VRVIFFYSYCRAVYRTLDPPLTPKITNECWELIKGMLTVNPNERLSAYKVLSSPLFLQDWDLFRKSLLLLLLLLFFCAFVIIIYFTFLFY